MAQQLPLDLGCRPALEADDFLVAPSNGDAVAWLEPGRSWPGPALVLSGPVGSGKSHLARVWAARTGAVLVGREALVVADVADLLPSGRSVAVAVDGADAVAGDALGERALLHLFNLVAEGGGRLLLTGTTAAAGWGLRLPDLASRLRAAPSVALGPPGDDLLAAMLVKLLADRQLQPPTEVVAYLVPRMERSGAAVQRLAAELDLAALAAHRPITLPLARTVLAALNAEGQPSPAPLVRRRTDG